MSTQFTKFIIVGEDDKDDQELLKDVFGSIDDTFRLMFVDSGKEVISLLDKLQDDQQPCLFILDYNMPELSGADILQELNEIDKYKDTPKIIWSTSRSESFRNKCLALGATDYIIKPSSLKELETSARYMLSVCQA